MRGKILHLTREAVLRRALGLVRFKPELPLGHPPDAVLHYINYRLDDSGLLGGRDPERSHCADWSYGLRTPTSDCIGFALWVSGIDRLQPGYAGLNGEWLNCTSLLHDARTDMKYCRPLQPGELARPGDWLLTKDHIGVIVLPDIIHGDHIVVDCSPRHGRDHAIDLGRPWSVTCLPIRPLFYAEP